ncbi:DUF4198 domain-containing protein [uncultured Marinobacter sp.]|uniref:DUF4198 domain-containing protein n=1 Tax=uncultured Marinobacter sp. TaxID=187379 RepID=UPI0030D9CE15
MKRNTLLTATCLVLGLTAASTGHAHRAWMLPSATVLSGENVWVTVDAAVSNSIFYFEYHPLGLDGLIVKAPDGAGLEPQNQAQTRYRSVFDVELTQEGTYTVEIRNDGLFGRYNLNGEAKRWRGSLDTLTELPADAKDLELTESQRRMQVFVTRGAPSFETLKPVGQGLELVPLTHPNDLFVGEQAQFRFTIDGEPAKELDITLIREGIRYRDQVEERVITTDAEGIARIDWTHPGMYWLETQVETSSKLPQVGERRLGYSATLEVLPL